MAIKDILVHVDSTTYNESRLTAAVDLAVKHDAHLVGLYVLARADIPQFIRIQLGTDLLEAQNNAAKKYAADAEAQFRDICIKADLSYEWRCAKGHLAETLILHTRYADLTIVGQKNSESEGISGGAQLPDRLILSAGRPVLVIPSKKNIKNILKDIGSHIMVSWDASRLATCAINNAIPLLQKAKSIKIMTVNPHGKKSHGGTPRINICQHLSYHNIQAEIHYLQSSNLDPGDMLLSYAADNNCDMIVMGAYGHSRWREIALGGVTRHMLAHMTMPVFMSH